MINVKEQRFLDMVMLFGQNQPLGPRIVMWIQGWPPAFNHQGILNLFSPPSLRRRS
jgi:hypothetical protein